MIMRELSRPVVALSLAMICGLMAHAGSAAPSVKGSQAAQGNQGQSGQEAGQSKPSQPGQQSGQAGQGKPGQQGGQAAAGPQATPEEAKSLQAIQNELDAERTIQMANDFEKKFPNSNYLTYVYTFAASACQQKGDINKVVEYGQKSLKLKPDNLMSLIIMASMLPQPQLLRGSEDDKEKKLSEAEKDANQALQLIAQLPKQANETDEQFQKRKAVLGSELHSSLGMVHLQRSSMGLQGPDKDELSKSEQEYKTALSTTERPNPQDYYRLGEAYLIDGKTDEAIDAFSKASQLSQGSVLKTYADQRVEELKKKQSAAQPPAKP